MSEGAARDAHAAEILVLHAITSLAVGGAEQQLVNLVRGSSETQVRHVVCQLGPPDDLVGRLREVGCEVIRLSDRRRRRYLGAYRGLAAEIARVQPDVIHSWLFHARFATFLARRRRAPAHIASLQGTDYEAESIAQTGLSASRMAAQRLVERMMAARQVSYVAASQAVKDSYVQRAKIAPERVRVIPNSVDPARVRTRPLAGQALRLSLGIPENAFLFVNVSRLISGKGHSDLLHAFERLAARHPDLRLAVAGDGPLRSSLLRIAPHLHDDGRIRMLGTVTALSDLLSAADAFVFPSRYSEGLPLALAEAMFAGLPMAAADTPVAREMAGDPPALLLTPPGDVDALAASMLRLKSEPDVALSLGAEAKRRADELYAIERTIPLWVSVYEAARAAT